MSALLSALVFKGSILMIAAAAAVALLYRASAATRHFVWTLAVAGLLLLPALSATLPTWQIAIPLLPADVGVSMDAVRGVVAAPAAAPAVAAPLSAIIDNPSEAMADGVPWVMVFAAIYVLGVLLLLGRLAVQQSQARRIAREATVITDADWTSLLDDCVARIGVVRRVILRRSREQLMPMTMGTLKPSVVVPADADAWDEDRRRAVLLHELAHISRHDCLTQMLCAMVCALYWVHPGTWYVARRLRIEREVACDDCVLVAGAHAPDYASHLLELAYTWSGRRAPALAVGMAGSRKLEGRMRAVLDPRRNRTTPTRRLWLAGAALTAAVLLAIAGVSMTTTASADVRSTLMSSAVSDTSSLDAALEQGLQAAGGADRITGTWEVRPGPTSERVSLRLKAGDFSANHEIDASELDRLMPQLLSSANGPIRFNIAREAGTLQIEGTLKAGAGSGTFTFVPSETFIAALTARGFTRPTAGQLLSLARQDIGLAFIDELAAQKYTRPEVSELVRAAEHGVDIDFVREMGQAGYRLGTLDTLIRFRDHGVDPEFIRELRTQGLSDLSPDDLVRARDHGVNAEYVGGLRDVGYASLPFQTLVRARDHGVDPEFVRGMRQLGHTPALEDAIRARDHGVDPEFVGEMRRVGYTLTVPELIRARDHGVTPDYIEAIAAVGYKTLPIETLIRLRDHGVTPEFVAEAKKRGYNNLSVDEVIRLRDRGVASSDYHMDRLVAYLSETRLAREIEKILRKSEKAVDKSQKAVDKLTR